MKLSKLNLCCGHDYMKGWINADISPACGADMSFNMEYGLPFKDSSMDEIVCNNGLTQISTPQKFMFVMNELHRVCKPGGSISIRVPNAEHICSWQDPMDCRRFTVESFTYMQYDHRRFEQYGRHYGFLPFVVELLDNNGRQMTFNLCPKKD